MTTGYQRQSVASIVNGLVINASDFNNEFNALLAAFDITTGHNHNGSTTGGGAIILAVNGVAYPNGASSNTVPVVTSANTITYEAVPNAALANSTITLGSTSTALGSTTTSINGLTLAAGSTSGTFTLGGPVTATSRTITGGTFSGPLLTTATTSGLFTLGGNLTAAGFSISGGTLETNVIHNPLITGLSGSLSGTLTGGTYASPTISSPAISSPTITGTASVVNLNTSGLITLGGNISAAGNTISSPVITGATITTSTLGSGAGTGCTLGAALTITGQSVVGGGTGLISGCVLASNTVATTAAIGDNDTSVATTAYVQKEFSGSGQQSLATNGYQNISSTGAIMQWGAAATAASGFVIVSFPTPFPNNCFNIQLTLAQAGAPANPAATHTSVGNVSASQFTGYVEQAGVGIASSFFWYAVGN